MKFHVITRCTRVENLLTIADSVYKDGVDVTWHVVFDTSVVKEVEASLLGELYRRGAELHFKQGSPGTYMYPEMNELVKTLPSEDYVTLIDDDNIVHPDYYDVISSIIDAKETESSSLVICYNQLITVDNPTYRHAIPSNVVVGGIDLAQFTFAVENIHSAEFGSGYCGDGEFIQAIHSILPNRFVFIDQTLCYYNYLQQVKPKKTSAPKILYIGEGKPELKSLVHLGYEDTSLNVYYNESVEDVDPDAIITVGGSYEEHTDLTFSPLDIRRRWVHFEEEPENLGEIAYNVAMNYILNTPTPKVSFFTPAYNTPLNRLWRLYESIRAQTSHDWEWVIVNDSPKNNSLSEELKRLSNLDSRIKIFTFNKASGGVIGDVKYKAASLCRGDILAEVDHDDELEIRCCQYLIEASEAHPECGFFYTDCVELNEMGESMTYPDGFAFGYGSYRKEGKWDVSVCVGINPKTIRHIVGVPNHIRAWRRDTYQRIGGHNRRLTIADDYELIVRTFLKTKFCHIEALGYYQYIYNNDSGQNTHDATRGDIQRRVRSIANHYNHDISQRFYQLGVRDWAYKGNPSNPLLTPSRMGSKQKSVNVKYTPKG
jgi:glycosyltransferase involved in cell wall biosynthesis